MSVGDLAVLDDIKEVLRCDLGSVRSLHEVHHLGHAHHWNLVHHHEPVDWVDERDQDALREVGREVLDRLRVYVGPGGVSQTGEDETCSQELLLQGMMGYVGKEVWRRPF